MKGMAAMAEFNINDLYEKINDAEKILVGIGREMEAEGIDALVKKLDIEGIKSIKDNNQSLYMGYQKLLNLIKDKDYRIISLARDDIATDVFGQERLVAPCGSLRRFQCDVNCNGIIYDDLNQFSVENKTCPECGAPIVFNTIDAERYNEEGYIADFDSYKKWLQSTVNRKLVIIELGVDMRYPSVIRLPFDKLCFYNQKSTFYRINNNLYQHTAENAERGVTVKMNSKEFLNILD